MFDFIPVSLGLLLVVGMVAYSKGKIVYLVDKSNIDTWLAKYKLNLSNLRCSSCNREISKKNIKRIFKKDGKTFVLCKITNCQHKTLGELNGSK